MSDCTGPHTSVFDCPEHSPTRPAPERAESERRDVFGITHWRPAIPEGADRMIVAATDPEGA